MLAIRRIIVVFVLLETSEKLLLTFERKKGGLRQFFVYLKMLKSHSSVAHDLTHVQLLIQKLKVLLKSLFMNISRNVATIRCTSCIRLK